MLYRRVGREIIYPPIHGVVHLCETIVAMGFFEPIGESMMQPYTHAGIAAYRANTGVELSRAECEGLALLSTEFVSCYHEYDLNKDAALPYSE